MGERPQGVIYVKKPSDERTWVRVLHHRYLDEKPMSDFMEPPCLED